MVDSDVVSGNDDNKDNSGESSLSRRLGAIRFVKLACLPCDVLKRVLSVVGAERSGMERRFRLTVARNPATL